MLRSVVTRICGLLLVFLLATPILATASHVKGIYITQSTGEHTRKMQYLIRESKKVGITTFIIDYDYRNSRYAKNIALVKANGIRYVARIVVFPYGAKGDELKSQKILSNRLRRIQGALALGADAIQLDYIRYTHKRFASEQNIHNIHQIIKYFRSHIPKGVELQVDVFGVVAHGPSIHIGQDIRVFADTVDTFNPMVYPSHYEPYRWHAQRPYETVLESITKVNNQLRNHSHVKVNAFIELYNYRYPLSRQAKVQYIKAQIKGAKDAGADSCYVWSAQNKYSILFDILKNSPSP